MKKEKTYKRQTTFPGPLIPFTTSYRNPSFEQPRSTAVCEAHVAELTGPFCRSFVQDLLSSERLNKNNISTELQV